MKSLVVVLLSILLTVSVQAQGHKVIMQIGNETKEQTNFWDNDAVNGIFNFKIIVPVLYGGQIDTAFVSMEGDLLVIIVKISAQKVQGHAGTKVAVVGNIDIDKIIFEDVQYRYLTAVQGNPPFHEVKIYDRLGTNITPPVSFK